MGACTSKQNEHSDIIHSKQLATLNNTDTVEKDKVQKQRRKLSVAPQHVGDIAAGTTNNINKPVYAGARKGSIIATGDTVQPALPTTNNNNTVQLDPDELIYTGSALSNTDIQVQQQYKLSHATRSKKGLVPYNRNKVNQDRAFIKYSIGPQHNIPIFGVMDGHGEFGHLVASFVQDKLPQALHSQGELLITDTETAIYNAVKHVVAELHDSTINAAFSGTTCVFAVLIDKTLYIANIGDSRCILGTRSNNQIVPIQLTNDQKPEVPAEKQRILAAGGRVEPLPGPPGEDCGPPRVWLAEVDVPGLAMSRSIGDDVSQTVGVTSIPEITKHTINSDNDLFVIWASDGVWEFLTNEQVVSIIYKNIHNLHNAATLLVEESTKQWKSNEEVIDDITTIVLQLKQNL